MVPRQTSLFRARYLCSGARLQQAGHPGSQASLWHCLGDGRLNTGIGTGCLPRAGGWVLEQADGCRSPSPPHSRGLSDARTKRRTSFLSVAASILPGSTSLPPPSRPLSPRHRFRGRVHFSLQISKHVGGAARPARGGRPGVELRHALS